MDYANCQKMDIEHKISDKLKQRIAIQFAMSLGEAPADICAMINRSYGAAAMSDQTTKRWIQTFQRMPNHRITDSPHTGQLRTARTAEHVANARQVIANNRTITCRNLGVQIGTDRTTAHQIVHRDLLLKKKCAKFVPHVLNPAQHANCAQICHHWIRMWHQQGFADRIITGDETYCFAYDPKSKKASMEWLPANANRLQKAHKECSTEKLMLTVL